MLAAFFPSRDERAALQFEDLASAFDAGLNPASMGGNAALGERMLPDMLAGRGVAIDSAEGAIFLAAWKSGSVSKALRERAAARRQRAELTRVVKSSLRYPLILVATTALVCAVSLRSHLWLAVLLPALLLAIAVVAWRVVVAIRAGTGPWLRLPLLGPLARDFGEIPYLQVLHGLYAAGVPLLTAHPQAVAACGIGGVRRRLQDVDRIVQGNRPLGEALAQVAALHPETSTMIRQGELTGGLEDALARAVRRRTEVAAREAAAMARRLGATAYLGAAIVAIYVILSFYSSYYGQLRVHH
jgi:general secretion pathway protein F